MNEILTLVTFLALLFYTGIEMKFQLQMLQQNSYRNDRYNRWLKGESVVNQLPADIRTNRHDYSGLGKKRKRVTNQI